MALWGPLPRPCGEAGPGVPGRGSRFPCPVRSVPADAGGGPRRAGGPAPGGLWGPRLLVLHRLHPGADALSLGGWAVVPGWQHRAAGYKKTWTYYCRPGPGAELCTVRHLLGRFCGTHPHCLNTSCGRNGPGGIVFLVTYARRGSWPGEPAEDMEAALHGITVHFRHRGALADELGQFLKDDFCQLMGQYPGYLAQCQAMSQIPPAHFPGRAREILAGLGTVEGVLAGMVPDKVVSMRPCLWEVGAGEAQASEKLHTYFTRLDGGLDAKWLLEEIWGHSCCLNSHRCWEGRVDR
ncbi:uncharacterized protein LOC115640659 isoform X2 [Gopherus evgoodei]|uniref:uncharacterized protein LOC115640659 isoform X2 n=1 Tax=Gopherus evgoodei TaxID=1825980 RepID=UPI0011CFD093|nr:uncharacterized protein LOC115640659 isoform X2 [Gopherus evgoodei]